MAGGDRGHPRVERTGDEGERTALTASLDGVIAAVELGKRRDEVTGTDDADVHALVVVVVAVFEPVRPVVLERGRPQLAVKQRITIDWNAMDPDREVDHSLLRETDLREVR